MLITRFFFDSIVSSVKSDICTLACYVEDSYHINTRNDYLISVDISTAVFGYHLNDRYRLV